MKTFNKKELSIIGAILYRCEGTQLRRDKRRKNEVYHWVIEFTNSDPLLIKLFLDFLRRVIVIDETRLKAQLFIHNDLDKLGLQRKWSKIAGIPLKNFNKTIVLRSKGPNARLSRYGTLKIRYHSKEAFQRFSELIHDTLM